MVQYVSTIRQPLCNVMVGRETLNKLKAVLNLKNSNIWINGLILPMQSLSAINYPQCVMNIYRKSLELGSMREATHLLDIRFETVDLLVVVYTHFQHLNECQQNSLLLLLLKFQELFDKTLRNWDTKPVTF